MIPKFLDWLTHVAHSLIAEPLTQAIQWMIDKTGLRIKVFDVKVTIPITKRSLRRCLLVEEARRIFRCVWWNGSYRRR
jgi:hypothetical protein